MITRLLIAFTAFGFLTPSPTALAAPKTVPIPGMSSIIPPLENRERFHIYFQYESLWYNGLL